jgi:hypothetical protein
MKITPTGVGDALKSLKSNRFYPISDMALSPNPSGHGTGFRKPAPPPPPPKHKVNIPAGTPQSAATPASSTASVFTFADVASKNIQRKEARTRSFSSKRNLEVSPSSDHSNKIPRMEGENNKNLSAIQENLTLLEQVANDILDATASDPVLVSIVSRLCTGITVQNNVLTAILSHKNSTISSSAGNVADSADSDATPQSEPTVRIPNLGSCINEAALNKRKPLRQNAIGNTAGEWTKVSNNKESKKSKQQSSEQTSGASLQQGQHTMSKVNNTGDDPFLTAVREAERSVVIYNLNLGQSPLINPSTISSKVTAALLSSAATFFKDGDGDATALAGELVNDLLSQVKIMDLFGKGMKPCKDLRNPSSNGSFYTVPVKLSFQNKQVAKQVNEILRKQYKVSTSIPYHRTLKKAMSLAHEKVLANNKHMQVMISLDAANKVLKPYVRDTPSGKGKTRWIATGKTIPLPTDALDPRIKDVSEDFSLPTSPTFADGWDRSPGVPSSGNTTKRLKIGEQAQASLDAAARATAGTAAEGESAEATRVQQIKDKGKNNQTQGAENEIIDESETSQVTEVMETSDSSPPAAENDCLSGRRPDD